MEKVCILVLSPFVLLREGLNALLSRHPRWRVICEGDWEASLNQNGQIAPDVVIVETGQADAAFQKLIDRLKSLPNDPAVIVITYRDDQATLIRILRSGVQGCLSRESSFEDLVAAIEAVLAGGSFLCPAAARVLLQDYRRQARSTARGAIS